jgi:molybdopterin molybdotransferase
MVKQNYHPKSKIMAPQELVSVEQAREMISENMISLAPAMINISEANHLVIAEDIFSPLDLPAFDQSSMDGYAIYSKDITLKLAVQGVITAGYGTSVELLDKHAMRIFTGAPLPGGADTIVMQEKVKSVRSGIQVTDTRIEKGMYVRKKGSELKKGELVLKEGQIATAPVAGLLASLGLTQIKVHPRLRISVIATGNELQTPGESLKPGHSYESNVSFLKAALQSYCSATVSVFYVADELEKIQETIAEALPENDLIILTGGVSVGDYDFVRKAADRAGIICKFHKVRQRPGKPLYFGKKDATLVFGLPGNPASVITCFYEYVLPSIKQIMHLPQEPRISAELKNSFRKVEGLTQFLKGFMDGIEVEILEAQESYRLRSFARANCLVCLSEQRVQYEKGEIVSLRLLPI